MQVSPKFGYVRHKKKFLKKEGWEVSGWLSPIGSPRTPVNPLKISTPFTVESLREMNSSPRYPDCKSHALSFLVEQCRTPNKLTEAFSRSIRKQNVCLGTEYSVKGLNGKIKQKSSSSSAINGAGKQSSLVCSARSMDELRELWGTRKGIEDVSKQEENLKGMANISLSEGIKGDYKLADSKNSNLADIFISKNKRIGSEDKKRERIAENKINLIHAPEFSHSKETRKLFGLENNADFKHKPVKKSKNSNFVSPKSSKLNNMKSLNKKLSKDSSMSSESGEEFNEFMKSPFREDEFPLAERNQELNEYLSKSPAAIQSAIPTQNYLTKTISRHLTETSDNSYNNPLRKTTYDSTNNSCETQKKLQKLKKNFNSGRISSNQYWSSINQAEQTSPFPLPIPPKISSSSISSHKTLSHHSPVSPAPYKPSRKFYSKEKLKSSPAPSYFQTYPASPDLVNQGSKYQNPTGLVQPATRHLSYKTNMKASNNPKISLGKIAIKKVKSKVDLLIDKAENLTEENTINSLGELLVMKDGLTIKESNSSIAKKLFSISPEKKKSAFKHNTGKKVRKRRRKSKNKTNKSNESSDSAIKTITVDSSKIITNSPSKNSDSSSLSRFISNFSISLLSALSFNPPSIEDNVSANRNEKLEFDISKLTLFTQPIDQFKLLQKKIIRKKMKIELNFVLKQFTDKYRNKLDEKILKSLINRIRKSLLSEGVKLEIISYLKNAEKLRSKSKIIKDVERILKKRFRNNRKFSVEFSSSQSDESLSISSNDSAEMREISKRERDLQKYRYELTHMATFKNSGIKREVSIRPDLVELEPVQIHECNFEEEEQEVSSIASQMNWCKYKQMYKFLCTSPVVPQECPKISRKPIESNEKIDYKDDIDFENLEHIASKRKFYNLNDRNICKSDEYVFVETDANLADPSEVKALEKDRIRKHVNRIRNKNGKFMCQTN